MEPGTLLCELQQELEYKRKGTLLLMLLQVTHFSQIFILNLSFPKPR
jgi:hypothetical protein